MQEDNNSTSISTSECTSSLAKQALENTVAPSREVRGMSKGRMFLLITLLGIALVQASYTGLPSFIGRQGWAFVLNGNTVTGQADLFQGGSWSMQAPPLKQDRPEQMIRRIVQKMTVEQKLGQMMMVQFVGSSYSPTLHTMVRQYGAGAVTLFASNGNIINQEQLKTLIQDMQRDSALPLAIAIDHEGGIVNRLQHLNGPRPAATVIGATNDPGKAEATGRQDAQDLAAYGINLNLAPVVDVSRVHNPQLVTRSYGSDPELVSRMASAYLQGLQQSGHVFGTLKHFPGLGDVAVDPHIGITRLTRPKSYLEQVAWVPYRTLIQQKLAHAIMVTHEVVTAIDNKQPATLSALVVNKILRQELGFRGVIMTDSLTMEGVSAYQSAPKAAALAVIAGSDLLMGARTANEMRAMMSGIKQAMHEGTISQNRLDESVSRILMLKYRMGLLKNQQINKNR